MTKHDINVFSEDDDVEPPLLVDDATRHLDNQRDDAHSRSGADPHGDKSIMDEMMAIAQKANETKQKQRDMERRNTKGFGSGLKKGFFASSSTKTKKIDKTSSSKTLGTPRERLEVRDDASDKRFQVASTSSNSQQPTDDSSTPFVFPEVQDALKGMNQLNPNEWINQNFFDKFAKHPKLLQALQNPRFMQAINDLQRDPGDAVLKYQKDPDVSLMLRDFMGFLGNHFEEMGKESERSDPAKQEAQQQPQQLPPKVPAIVDLDETRRDAIANMPRAPHEEQQVQEIMKNPELLAALSDAKFMERLRSCQENPHDFQQLMRDPVFGAKLNLLIDAKMVAFA